MNALKENVDVSKSYEEAVKAIRKASKFDYEEDIKSDVQNE